MATLYGWTGKILRVDLTTGKITETPTSDYVPKYIGGRGVGGRIYWETVPPECGAFDPENALIFMTGSCAGTFAPTATQLITPTFTPTFAPTITPTVPIPSLTPAFPGVVPLGWPTSIFPTTTVPVAGSLWPAAATAPAI